MEVSAAGPQAASQGPKHPGTAKGQGAPCRGFITWVPTPKQPPTVSNPGSPTLPLCKNPLSRFGAKIHRT